MGWIVDLLLPFGIFVFIFYWGFFLYRRSKYYKNVPGPPQLFFFGNALEFTSTASVLPSLFKYVKEYGGILKIQLGPLNTTLIVTDPKILEFILNSGALSQKSSDYSHLMPWLGTGLLLSDGPKWKSHRKILTPAFHIQLLENFVDTFEKCGDILLSKLSQEVDKKSTNIYPFVTLCTLDIICETTMGTKINAQSDVGSEYVHSVKEMCRILIERVFSPIERYNIPFFFTRNYSIQQKALQVLHEKSNSVIKQRIRELKSSPTKSVGVESSTGKKKRVFLDILLEGTVDGQPLTQEEIREEVDTFMFAGHDTTASAISFTLYCLANNPTCQQLAYQEQLEIFQDTEKCVATYADLQKMKYLELVIKESMRIYPPVPFISRKADRDITYENTIIHKGDSIIIFTFGNHRNPKNFENPEVFNPERFENGDIKNSYTYLPFSAGPRNCIGQKYAMLEMKCLLSKIIRKFELGPAYPEHKVELVSEAVLKSDNGINISLKLRS